MPSAPLLDTWLVGAGAQYSAYSQLVAAQSGAAPVATSDDDDSKGIGSKGWGAVGLVAGVVATKLISKL